MHLGSHYDDAFSKRRDCGTADPNIEPGSILCYSEPNYRVSVAPNGNFRTKEAESPDPDSSAQRRKQRLVDTVRSWEGLRVARAAQERKVVMKRQGLFRRKPFLVVDGYDPRIHVVYFCPQLYRYDSDKKLVPLPGEEIGKLIAQSIEGGLVKRRIWYEPSEKLPEQPVISAPPPLEFDTVVVDMASARNSATTGS